VYKRQIGTLGLGLMIIISLVHCKTVQIKEMKPQLDAYFKQQEGTLGEGDKPGYSIIITKKDSIIYKRNFGSADLDKKTPITGATIFDIASTGKQFTGMAIALLEEQGKININDKITSVALLII
jgi:CubicO group peptidase (beta-lactamase class C family)